MVWRSSDKTADGDGNQQSQFEIRKMENNLFRFWNQLRGRIRKWGDAWHTFAIYIRFIYLLWDFFLCSVTRPVYLVRNAAQTTDQLPMTLTVCGRDNFIARCSVVYATCAIARTRHIELQFGTPKNNRQPHTTLWQNRLAAGRFR